jgi:hypothetical protein
VPPLPPPVVVVNVSTLSVSLALVTVTVGVSLLVVISISLVDTTTRTEPSVVTVYVDSRRTLPPSVPTVAVPPGTAREVLEGARQPEMGPRFPQALQFVWLAFLMEDGCGRLVERLTFHYLP